MQGDREPLMLRTIMAYQSSGDYGYLFGSEMLCKEHKWLNNNTVVSPKRAHYGLSAHIPMFCFDFLLRSKTYSKERPPSASIANRGFPLSMKTEHVVRLVYIHYKVLLLSGLH